MTTVAFEDSVSTGPCQLPEGVCQPVSSPLFRDLVPVIVCSCVVLLGGRMARSMSLGRKPVQVIMRRQKLLRTPVGLVVIFLFMTTCNFMPWWGHILLEILFLVGIRKC